MPLLIALFLTALAQAHPFDHLTEELAANPELVDVSHWPGIKLDFRYATPNNFMHKDVYGPFHSCFLHGQAAAKLKHALATLKAKRTGWSFRAFDCLRPVRAQEQLWDVVKSTPNHIYVANPAIGSLHSYGFAIDISLNDENGKEVDMGATFDFFGAKGEPRHEAELVKSGALTQDQYRNRLLLRSILEGAGFHSISTEWWHFDGRPGAEVREKYRPID